MKCKVIEDLLPLYIDNTCSQENKVLIEEHLKTCPKCSELYKFKSENIEDDFNLDNQIDIINPKENDLIKEANKNIKFQLTKERIYKFIIILNILFILADYLFIKLGDYIEYPRFFFDTLGIKIYIILFVLILLPIFFSILGLYIVSSKNYIEKFHKLKNVISISILVITILISTFSNLILLSIPPIESYTNSTENYLVIHSNIYKEKYKEFFPETIPEDATNIKYTYRKYESLFQESIKFSASWSLPKESYEYYKQLVEDKFELTLIGNNKYQIDSGDIFLKLIFEYDDSTNELIYAAIIES